MKITKSDFLKYLKVQMSGKCNMLDIPVVSAVSGLSGAKVLEIINNYDTYSEKWDS